MVVVITGFVVLDLDSNCYYIVLLCLCVVDNGSILHPSRSPWVPKKKPGFSTFLLILGVIGFLVSKPRLLIGYPFD